MSDAADPVLPRGQGTVQLCAFAVGLNRKAARALTENNKITASAAVIAFSRLSRKEQLRLCAEARRQHADTVAAMTKDPQEPTP